VRAPIIHKLLNLAQSRTSKWSEVNGNTAWNLKTEVFPTRKCARVPIKPPREAGTGTGIETKTPNGIKENKLKKIGREEIESSQGL
jgi:hypothetical protein